MGGAVAKPSLRAVLVAAALLFAPVAAQAAGLGKLTVLSNLGQPLRAEIDVVAVEKGEMDTLAARLASIDAYLQNNLPYPSPALGLKLSLEQRASGQPYIRATTVQPVNEPFVDVLVELTWNGGRILRAYTALLDPPTYAAEEPAGAAVPPTAVPQTPAAPTPAPQPQVPTQLGSEFQPREPAAPEVAATPDGAAMTPEAGGPPETLAAAPEAHAPAPETTPRSPAPVPAPRAAQPEEAGMPPPPPAHPTDMDMYEVKRGDTLSKIAQKYKPADVSLEQMLVALFRDNPEAFAGKNMNRLKTGPLVSIPSASEAASVDAKAAKREVRLQTANWNAYKERVAGAVGTGAPATEEAGQAAGGKVTAPVEDRGALPQAQPKEVLKLSKGETGGSKAAQDRIHSLEEEVAARERTIKEQAERVAKLEKTVKDMQALIDIKSRQGAEMQKQVAPAPLPEPKPAKPSMPEPAKPELPAPPPAHTMPAQPPVAAEPVPQDAASMAQSGTAAAQTAQAKPKPVRKPTKPIAPEPEPQSLVDQILNEPMYLGAGAVVIALLGFLGFRMIKKRREGSDDFDVEAEKKNSDVAPLTGTDTSGSMQAAARAAAAAQVTEEVDPLAEAEIYLAYGRDSQAEEILKEALAANPRRYEIHTKLLEIYAKRKDLAAFDPIARELQMATGGQGEVWEQAARLGYQLDPQNPRYAAGKPSGAAAAAVAAAAVGATGVAALDEKLDFNIGLEDADVGTKTDIDLTPAWRCRRWNHHRHRSEQPGWTRAADWKWICPRSRACPSERCRSRMWTSTSKRRRRGTPLHRAGWTSTST